MKRLNRLAANDAGSVSFFIIGVFMLVLLLVATATDLAVLQLDRHDLQAQADGAALAAAQAADLTKVYNGGITTYVPINPIVARERALALLHVRSTRIAGFTVEAIATNGQTVIVRLSAKVRPPFLRLFGTSVYINASARATTAVG